MINSLGPVQPTAEKKDKWFSFTNNVKKDSKIVQVRLRIITPVYEIIISNFNSKKNSPAFIDGIGVQSRSFP